MRVALGDSRPAAAVGPDAVGVVGHRIRTAQQEDAERVAVVGIAGRRSDVHLDGAGAPVCPWTTRPIGRAARRVHWIDTSGVVFVNPV